LLGSLASAPRDPDTADETTILRRGGGDPLGPGAAPRPVGAEGLGDLAGHAEVHRVALRSQLVQALEPH